MVVNDKTLALQSEVTGILKELKRNNHIRDYYLQVGNNIVLSSIERQDHSTDGGYKTTINEQHEVREMYILMLMRPDSGNEWHRYYNVGIHSHELLLLVLGLKKILEEDPQTIWLT
jgi:hypothetical protein